MTVINQEIPGVDPKQQQILAAAFDAFSLYGFKRTSMEDIANGAGMSRAALYLHYRNKEDIFRSLAQGYYDMAVAEVSDVLQRDAFPVQALKDAFNAQAGPVFEALLASPHGQELLDAKQTHTSDIVADGDARLIDVYADWLRRQDANGTVDLGALGGDAKDVATTIYVALHGIKTSLPVPTEFRASINRLATLFGRALSK